MAVARSSKRSLLQHALWGQPVLMMMMMMMMIMMMMMMMMMDVNLHLDIYGVKKIETPEKLEERPGEEFFFKK